MTPVHHRHAPIDGHQLFYREAGPADAATIVLLHGYPTSSFMFRELIPRLAGRLHVIAPDHLGFGLSDAPPVTEFEYSFDALADSTYKLLQHLSVDRYVIYVQDYGAPIGWRLVLQHPTSVTAIVTQSGNGYDEGFVESFWQPVWDYQAQQTPETEAAIRVALGLDAIRWQYLHGVADPSVVSPDTWHHDHALVARPGNDLVQLKLFLDYASNPPLYSKLQEHLRATQLPVLAVWGAEDQIFSPAGAEAFRRDVTAAEIHLVDGGGHFLLESHGQLVAQLILDFIPRVTPNR